MKTSQDPRHKRRQRLIQDLFSSEFHTQTVSKEARYIWENKAIIDQKIKQAAPDFPIEKINKVDLAILRLAVYEMAIEKKTPKNVIIDEAVELAKEYANETSPAFINGVLAHINLDEKST